MRSQEGWFGDLLKGGCKDGWLPFGGNCFNFGNALPGHRPSNNDLKDNYIEAQNTCNKMGGHLATPTNIYQMAFVAANSYSISQQFWLGIKSTSLQDKSFHWDGIQPEILTYSNWDSISPRGNSGNNADRNRDTRTRTLANTDPASLIWLRPSALLFEYL